MGLKLAGVVAGILTGLGLACSMGQPVQTATPPRFQVRTVVSGLNRPWGLAFLPDGDLLVTERPGRLSRIPRTGGDPQPISGVPPVVAQGQGGLLDVVLHPQFEQNRWVYLSLAGGQPGQAGTQVVRGQLQGNQLVNVQTIVDMPLKTGSGQHFGSRLAFDAQGRLYVGTGDRGQPQRAQDVADHAGKVLRVNEDGSIPADNPMPP
ncbi:MAG: PQQ-dependent sugar dehydrogenase, partial [Thermostichales cyanobacterium BF4_bins_65]